MTDDIFFLSDLPDLSDGTALSVDWVSMLILRASAYQLRMYIIRWPRLWGFVLGTLFLLFFNEFLIYYFVLLQCSWPHLDYAETDFSIRAGASPALRVMMLADTHLLGSNSHWFDKLRREWQMERSFQTVSTIHSPDVVFVLGDLFDDGKWCSNEEFEDNVARFKNMFRHPDNINLQVVAGNHDLGFHYMMNKEKITRFTNHMQAPPVRKLDINGNTFLLINSMALEGDGCDICREAENSLKDISLSLNCAKGMPSASCTQKEKDALYTKPILLQHFPMYRPSDSNCTGPDAAHPDNRDVPFKPKWDCLSSDSSRKLFSWFHPRLIVSGHTHDGCFRRHRDGTPEHTVASFNWRNRNNPTFLLAVINNNNFAVKTCYLPEEDTVIYCYVFGMIFLVLWAVFPRNFLYNTPSRKAR